VSQSKLEPILSSLEAADTFERMQGVSEALRDHYAIDHLVYHSTKAAREFLQVASSYGVGNQGFSIPIRGPNGQFALFTVNHSCDDAAWSDFTQMHRRDLILIAHCFNEKALEFEPGRTPEQSQALSPREIDAMTLLAIGYSRAQVANSLSISEHTLRVYIESARFKLGALNTTHAVARAMSRGLIVV